MMYDFSGGIRALSGDTTHSTLGQFPVNIWNNFADGAICEEILGSFLIFL